MIERAPRPAGPASAEAASINLFWLIHLRWAAALGQLMTILFVAYGLGIALPLPELFAILGLELLSNLVLEHWFRARRARGLVGATRTLRRLAVLLMLTDTILLTVLLYLTGGATNPFCAFFFVHVVLAAVLLRARWAYAGALFACLCLWVLYVWHRPLPVLDEQPRLWLQGMVVALGMAAVITVVFVSRVTRALERRSQQLAVERERQARAERLEALGTLAAGAAHELATPLSTIAVVAKELERRLVLEKAPEDDLEDARLVREQVARCRRILDRMTLESGDGAAEVVTEHGVGELLEETVSEIEERGRVVLEIGPEAAALRLWSPRSSLAMALRSVISNALDASQDPVVVRARRSGEALDVEIEDRGEGMDPERARRATDPFFTTKEPGRGMGLGLFLTRSVVERLGGELTLESRPGEGTRARVRLPLERLRRGGTGAERGATLSGR